MSFPRHLVRGPYEAAGPWVTRCGLRPGATGGREPRRAQRADVHERRAVEVEAQDHLADRGRLQEPVTENPVP